MGVFAAGRPGPIHGPVAVGVDGDAARSAGGEQEAVASADRKRQDAVDVGRDVKREPGDLLVDGCRRRSFAISHDQSGRGVGVERDAGRQAAPGGGVQMPRGVAVDDGLAFLLSIEREQHGQVGCG